MRGLQTSLVSLMVFMVGVTIFLFGTRLVPEFKVTTLDLPSDTELARMATQEHPLVHFVWITEKKPHTLMWHSVRSLLYAHPDAQVMIHSNTLSHVDLPGDLRVQIFYITFHTYDVQDIVNDMGLPSFLLDHEHAKYFASDLLRPLILRRYGGSYFDFDLILLRKLPDAIFMGREGPLGDARYPVNNGHMIMSSSAPDTRALMEECAAFVRAHVSSMTPQQIAELKPYTFGPLLLSAFIEKNLPHLQTKYGLRVLGHAALYPLSGHGSLLPMSFHRDFPRIRHQLQASSIALHLYGSRHGDCSVYPGSLLHRLIEETGGRDVVQHLPPTNACAMVILKSRVRAARNAALGMLTNNPVPF